MKTTETTDKFGGHVEVILDLRHLKKFERKGLVVFAPDTGMKITGLYGGKPFTCTYIDSADTFVYDGYKYHAEYFSGCFYPYLVREKLSPDKEKLLRERLNNKHMVR